MRMLVIRDFASLLHRLFLIIGTQHQVAERARHCDVQPDRKDDLGEFAMPMKLIGKPQHPSKQNERKTNRCQYNVGYQQEIINIFNKSLAAERGLRVRKMVSDVTKQKTEPNSPSRG